VALPQLPPDFAATRESLHRLAEDVIKPARERTSGEWTLIDTRGGFGTPIFGDDDQVRVEGAELVIRERGEERRAPIGSLSAAAAQIGARLLPGGLAGLAEEPLEVDPAASRALAAAYEVARRSLEEIRAAAGPTDDPTEPTLWPEHFDLAIEMGEEPSGRRANYGLSPGDGDHAEPYFYVGPWSAPEKPDEATWNGRGFTGAELGYAELAATADPVALAVEFALDRKSAIERTEP
jgi:hypothetical protein